MTNGKALGLVLGAAIVAGAAAVACSNYVPPDVGTYGPPGALSGKSPPVPETEDGGGSTSPPSGGEDAGGETGGGGAMVLCQQSGGALVDGGACTVSFTNDIYPSMLATGSWGCAASACHGNTTTEPLMNGTGAQALYDALANYGLATGSATVPYVNPCSTSTAATASGFVCNISTTNTCGIAMPQGKPMSTTDQQTITTWVECGAPFN